MDLRGFLDQLRLAAQSDEEAYEFSQEFARVRLVWIIGELKKISASEGPTSLGIDVPPATWTDRRLLAGSGVHPEWISDLKRPERYYLLVSVAESASTMQIHAYLESTGLSDKQQRLLFPSLYSKRKTRVVDDGLRIDVQRFNSWMNWILSLGISPQVFSKYQKQIQIHGASQNLSGTVGGVGASIAIIDAINEVGSRPIVDVSGQMVPKDVLSPEQVAHYVLTGGKPVGALLLNNGRAVCFASDPDIAIFQNLGTPFKSAVEAKGAWDRVRRDTSVRKQSLKTFVVGEVKTATDKSNLHERVALGSRETKEQTQTDRFLLMAILTKELLEGGTGRRSGRSLANKDVERFSDVFNLHFAWGWDGTRTKHPQHWNSFKRRIADWCGLSR